MGELADSDVERTCRRFVGERRGELAQAHGRPRGVLRARAGRPGAGLLRHARRGARRVVGSGSNVVALEGMARGGQLRDLLEGGDPSSGEVLRQGSVRVTGWDVTYSPPKSVSVLHAAGDTRVAAETLAAHRAAVRSVLGWLESDACWTRRGAGGARRLVGEGFVGVKYVHRVSRAGDAQLHSHVVIGNLTRADRRWTTLDGSLSGRARDTNGRGEQSREPRFPGSSGGIRRRRRPESNRCRRLCRPLRNHSATSPRATARLAAPLVA